MSCCCIGTDTIQKALAIAAVAFCIGAVDSAFRPVVEAVDKDKVQQTDLNALRQQRAATTPQPSNASQPSTPPQSPAPADEKLGYEISVAQAHSLFELGITFLDARHEEDFEKGHVQGAIRIAADEFAARAAEIMPLLPGPVVIYCSGGQCDASHNLAKLLVEAKFTQVHIMTDGFPGWEHAGFPTAKGAK